MYVWSVKEHEYLSFWSSSSQTFSAREGMYTKGYTLVSSPPLFNKKVTQTDLVTTAVVTISLASVQVLLSLAMEMPQSFSHLLKETIGSTACNARKNQYRYSKCISQLSDLVRALDIGQRQRKRRGCKETRGKSGEDD